MTTGPKTHGSIVIATASVVVLASIVAGCSSTTSAGKAPSSSRSQIPSSAYRDYTGITPNSVTIESISTKVGGLFGGTAVGAQAYADYVNAQGGINGRKIIVKSSDDGFQGAMNKQLTESALQNDFAAVGGFSLEDGFGGIVLASNPQMPNVSEVLDPSTAKLPNTFSPSPLAPGWPLGPLAYFKKKFPGEVLHTATLTADLPSTVAAWNDEKAAMIHLGYRVVYDPSLSPTTTDFTQNVIAMKDAGVKILFLEQSPENYASATIKALNQQNFHPVLVLGAPAYSQSLVADSGGPASIDGAYFEQSASLYLGEDAGTVPAIDTLLSWVQKASPGFHTDYFTLFGWLCTEMFSQALRNAGSNPSRGSLLDALRKVTTFTGSNLIPPSNPAMKVPISCYLVGQLKDGRFQRLDDPPVTDPNNGFRCDQPFYYPR